MQPAPVSQAADGQVAGGKQLPVTQVTSQAHALLQSICGQLFTPLQVKPHRWPVLQTGGVPHDCGPTQSTAHVVALPQFAAPHDAKPRHSS